MVKSIVIRTLYVLAFLVIILNTAISVYESLNPDINNLPKGELLSSCNSPNGDSRIDLYVVKADFGSAVRGEYVTGDTQRNIYWQTGTDTANVEWLSEKSILIDTVPLNVKTDMFDSRRGTAIFSEGVLAENINDNE